MFAGQGAMRMLYTSPNANFVEQKSGEVVINVTDSSGSIATLQAAINSARAANPTSVIVIRLTNTTYVVSSAGIVLGSHECLVASGATIQAANASITTPLVTITSGSTNVSVAGGTFDGSGANIQGIYAPAAARVNIDKVTVQNCGQDCILLKGNGNSTYDSEMTVTRCNLSGSPAHAGISIQNCTQAAVLDNDCHNNLDGIFVSCAWATVANNTCENNTTGIDVGGGSDNVIANNTCNNNGTGIHAGASNNMILSNATGNNSTAGISSDGIGNTFVDNLFTSGNTNNFASSGSGNRVVAYKTALNAPSQNYFYPPLIDDQHVNPIVNGMGRTDLTIASTTIADVQTQYDATRAANPNNVIVLHLNGTFTVGSAPLILASNTCVLLSGTIQINASTTASSAISDNNTPSRVSISGGIIDGGNLTGNNGIQFSSSSMLQVDNVTLRNFGAANPRVGSSDVIHFDHGSLPYIVTRCTINGGSARGIWLQLSGVKSVMSDNDVSNVNQDGVDCDSATSGCVAKFNYCHDLVRYGVFFEQSAAHNLALGNICNNDGRDINVYNNSATPRSDTAFNSIICNSLLGNNGLRNGSTGTNTVASSHNFFFNNTVVNASIASETNGAQNYYSQNYLAGGSLSTAGVEAFFNSTAVSSNLFIQDGNSGLAVQAQGGSTANGAAVVIDAASTLGHAQWQLVPTDSGFYRLMNLKSHLALAVMGASTNAGTSVIQFTFGSAKNDQWMPRPAGNGLYYFVNRLSGLCLDEPNVIAGTQLDQQPYTGASGQLFSLSEIILQPSTPFFFSANPSSQTVDAGEAANYTITMATNNGFSGPVTLSLMGSPGNSTTSFAPPTLSESGSSTLTINTKTNTPSGNYILTITGTDGGGNSNTAQISLTISAPGSNLEWNSTSSTAWDTVATNWFNDLVGVNDVFQNGKNVLFTDRSNVVTNVTIAPGVSVSPASVTVNDNGENYAISGSGKISGSGGLVKSGTSTLTISTTNDFTGPTIISGGVVSVTALASGGAASGIGAVGAGATNLVLDGGALRWTGGASVSVNRGMTVTVNGGVLDSSPATSASLTLSGPIAFSDLATLALTGTDPNPLNLSDNGISSTIADGSGAASIEKDGNDSWILSGNNSYTGGTVVNGGRLRANASVNAFGTGPVAVGDGAQAYLNVGGTFPNAFTLQGIGATETAGNLGALRLGVDGCTITNTITLSDNARITAFGASGAGAVISGQITGNGSLELGGSGSGANATNNVVAIADAYVLRSAATADQDETQTLNTKGLNDSNTRITYLRFDLGSLLNFYSVNDIQSVTLRLYMTGTSSANQVWVYGLNDTVNGTSDSAWTSAMTWNTQPARTASPNDIPQSSSALPNANTTGVLGLTTFGASAGEVDITLDITAFRALLTADSNHQITLLFHNSAGINAGWASISNTGGFLAPTLQIIGSSSNAGGVITLANGANNWSGDTIVSHGAVKLTAANAIPHGDELGDVFINGSSATVNSVLNLNGISTTIDGLNSQGNAARCIISNAVIAATLTVGDNDANGAFNGTIANGSSSLSLVKTGAGMEILGGANTYTGSTVVNGGGLIVNGSLASVVMSVMNGATLGGSGTIAGSVTVNPGATISPGNPVGPLTIGGNVALGGTTFIQLNKALATNDVIVSSASMSYGGVLSLTNLSIGLTAGDSFKIFAAGSYSGAFTNILPAIPAVGLAWNTNTLVSDGTLSIVAAPTLRPQIASITAIGSDLVISGSNGPAGWPYLVLTSTNLTMPASAWNISATNNFDAGGNFIFTNPADPAHPQLFYMLRLQ